jgi:hypothetical protein
MGKASQTVKAILTIFVLIGLLSSKNYGQPAIVHSHNNSNHDLSEVRFRQMVVTVIETTDAANLVSQQGFIQTTDHTSYLPQQTTFSQGQVSPIPTMLSPQLTINQAAARETNLNNVPKGSLLRREIIVAIRESFYANNRQLAVLNPDELELSFREFYFEQATGTVAVVLTKVAGNMGYLNPLPMLIFLDQQENSTWKLKYWISLPLMSRELEQQLLAGGLSPQFLRR